MVVMEKRIFKLYFFEILFRISILLFHFLFLFFILLYYFNDILFFFIIPIKSFLNPCSFIFTNIEEIFFLNIKLSVLFSFFFSIPFCYLQFWFFIKPTLYTIEKLFIKNILVLSIFFFFFIISLNYFLIIPITFKFLMSYEILNFSNFSLSYEANLKNYIEIILNILLFFIFLSQIPLLFFLFDYFNIISKNFFYNFKFIIYIVFFIFYLFYIPKIYLITYLFFIIFFEFLFFYLNKKFIKIKLYK